MPVPGTLSIAGAVKLRSLPSVRHWIYEGGSTLSNLVFTTGAFSSGSTLLFTLLRKSGEYRCFYEPLHERLREHLHAGLRVYDHHYHVDNYFAEYRGLREIDQLSDPRFGTSRLALSASDQAPELYRYLSYLIGNGFAGHPKVMLKFNRASFRLEWLRAAFPQAKVVHIYRDREGQWNSIVRRAQVALGRPDVGQDQVTFNGMNIATWCDDLAATYPELAASQSATGFERFSKLWELSRRESERNSHLTVKFEELTQNFDRVAHRSGKRSERRPTTVPSSNGSSGPKSGLPWRRSRAGCWRGSTA